MLGSEFSGRDFGWDGDQYEHCFLTMRVMTPDRVLTSDGAPDLQFFVICMALTARPHRHAW